MLNVALFFKFMLYIHLQLICKQRIIILNHCILNLSFVTLDCFFKVAKFKPIPKLNRIILLNKRLKTWGMLMLFYDEFV